MLSTLALLAVAQSRGPIAPHPASVVSYHQTSESVNVLWGGTTPTAAEALKVVNLRQAAIRGSASGKYGYSFTVSPSGRYATISTSDQGRETFNIIDLFRASTKLVPIKSPVHEVQWSPDSSRLLVITENQRIASQVWLVDPMRNSAKEIAQGPTKAFWRDSGTCVLGTWRLSSRPISYTKSLARPRGVAPGTLRLQEFSIGTGKSKELPLAQFASRLFGKGSSSESQLKLARLLFDPAMRCQVGKGEVALVPEHFSTKTSWSSRHSRDLLIRGGRQITVARSQETDIGLSEIKLLGDRYVGYCSEGTIFAKEPAFLDSDGLKVALYDTVTKVVRFWLVQGVRGSSYQIAWK